jgi:hypothetical protein
VKPTIVPRSIFEISLTFFLGFFVIFSFQPLPCLASPTEVIEVGGLKYQCQLSESNLDNELNSEVRSLCAEIDAIYYPYRIDFSENADHSEIERYFQALPTAFQFQDPSGHYYCCFVQLE